jgi:DNA-binding transcriptional ArsR family regulator
MISKEKILNFEARSKIFGFIDQNPGLNVNEISRRIEIPRTTLMHHIKVLEKQELVELKPRGKYTHIYTKNELGTQDKELLELLRKKIPCRILLHLVFSNSCSQTELSRELNLHRTTINYYLKKLKKMGIIKEVPVENGVIYPDLHQEDHRILVKTLRKRENYYGLKNQKILFRVGTRMVFYRNSLSNRRYIEEYLSFWEALSDWGVDVDYILKNAEKKVIKKDGKKVTHLKIPSEDKLYDFFFEFFRPPFCA